jgi:formate hydrogenlyase subunit 3/multisubunit Na+/H+ antiporter MnhD subunit
VVPNPEVSAWILYGFTFVGALGGIAGGLGAICNRDGKRFAAYLVLLNWSSCLVVLGVPSANTVAAAVYQHSASTIALAILLIVIGGLLESRRSDSLSGLKGIRKRCIFESLLLLGALASLANIPPFMGFPAAMNMIGALVEQNEPIVLLTYSLILVLQFVVCAKVVGLVFFAESDDSDGLFEAVGGLGTRLRVTLFVIFTPLLIAGVFWENVWMELVGRAAKFMVF